MLQGQQNLEDNGQGVVFRIEHPGVLTATDTV
jgi:hypothetical protein